MGTECPVNNRAESAPVKGKPLPAPLFALNFKAFRPMSVRSNCLVSYSPFQDLVTAPSPRGARRQARAIIYCPWAADLEDARTFLIGKDYLDVASRLPAPTDYRLLQMARLDCDWHAETVRALARMQHPHLDFRPAQVLGARGLSALVARPKPDGEEWWLILTGQQPQHLAGVIGRALAFLTRNGVRTLYYSFDEASRNMRCFSELAPHLSVLIHDEAPLDDRAQAALAPDCLTFHRSWVANLEPYAAKFDPEPEEKILFLGSELGYTPHRRRQVEFLQARFKDRMVAIHDHSVPVADRLKLARYKVSFCPEGRMFTTPGMSASHTDRPFWSGCLGLAPVAEDSREGGRLEGLLQAGLIQRYQHGDLADLEQACEAALALPCATRRRIYDYFNQHETIGTVVAGAIAAAGRPAAAAGDRDSAAVAPAFA